MYVEEASFSARLCIFDVVVVAAVVFVVFVVTPESLLTFRFFFSKFIQHLNIILLKIGFCIELYLSHI